MGNRKGNPDNRGKNIGRKEEGLCGWKSLAGIRSGTLRSAGLFLAFLTLGPSGALSESPATKTFVSIHPSYSYSKVSEIPGTYSEQSYYDEETIDERSSSSFQHGIGAVAAWYYEPPTGGEPVIDRIPVRPCSFLQVGYQRTDSEQKMKTERTSPLIGGFVRVLQDDDESKGSSSSDFFSLVWRHTFQKFYIQVSPSISRYESQTELTGIWHMTNAELPWYYDYRSEWRQSSQSTGDPMVHAEFGIGYYIPNGAIGIGFGLIPYHSFNGKRTYDSRDVMPNSWGPVEYITNSSKFTQHHTQSGNTFSGGGSHLIPVGAGGDRSLLLSEGFSTSLITVEDDDNSTNTMRVRHFSTGLSMRIRLHRAWSLGAEYDLSYSFSENRHGVTEEFTHRFQPLKVIFGYSDTLFVEAGLWLTQERYRSWSGSADTRWDSREFQAYASATFFL